MATERVVPVNVVVLAVVVVPVAVVAVVAAVVVSAIVDVVAAQLSNPTWHVFNATFLYPWQTAPPFGVGMTRG